VKRTTGESEKGGGKKSEKATKDEKKPAKNYRTLKKKMP